MEVRYLGIVVLKTVNLRPSRRSTETWATRSSVMGGSNLSLRCLRYLRISGLDSSKLNSRERAFEERRGDWLACNSGRKPVALHVDEHCPNRGASLFDGITQRVYRCERNPVAALRMQANQAFIGEGAGLHVARQP